KLNKKRHYTVSFLVEFAPLINSKRIYIYTFLLPIGIRIAAPTSRISERHSYKSVFSLCKKLFLNKNSL
ncbi:hypothetical protein P4K24_20180, partial [Bacillus cereus]|nr:hypothetical protein [Bacillus cereus]MEB9791499.1 hypothetical protein [Bacillus cereus]MEB9805823.1 hypothetical protein [Bacillus cereus]